MLFTVTLTDVICLTGSILFVCWLVRTSLGRNALTNAAPRRNNMPVYIPFVPFFIWLGTTSIAQTIANKLMGSLPEGDWRNDFLDNIILSISAVVTLTVIIVLARESFARRLKGFGLNIKTIHKDFLIAFANLLSVWPLVLAAIIVTTFAGRLIWGSDYQMQQHEELRLITTHSQLPLRILIFVMGVLVAPILEEMLFRGLFQTTIRSFLEIPNLRFHFRNAAWPAIVVGSFLFAMVHADSAHWPALFVLSLSLGYSYEKSGSLFRPIFIHSFFNAATIAAVLYQ